MLPHARLLFAAYADVTLLAALWRDAIVDIVTRLLRARHLR